MIALFLMSKKSCIAKACHITDLIFKELLANFAFTTEKDIDRFIRKRFKQYKVKPAYPPIVANNCSIIHPKPRKKKLKRGFLVLDFGAKYKGYCADMTRTLFIGKANPKEKKLYNLVKACQWKCVQKVRVGASCADLDVYARVLLKEYKKYFVHALGHGVGKKIHESPTLRPTSPEILKKGEIVTIEPGIYIKANKKETGIRIEDTLYVGNKVTALTKSPRQLIEIKMHKWRGKGD